MIRRSHTSKCPYLLLNLFVFSLTMAYNPRIRCSICEKGFTTAQQCSDHEFRHKNQRPFECNICDKTFKMKCDLRTHIMCHQDIRKHACPICGKSRLKIYSPQIFHACLHGLFVVVFSKIFSNKLKLLTVQCYTHGRL